MSNAPNKPLMPAHIARKVAVEAECDPRSVQRYADGKEVRESIRDRIERSLITLGMQRYILGGESRAAAAAGEGGAA